MYQGKIDKSSEEVELEAALAGSIRRRRFLEICALSGTVAVMGYASAATKRATTAKAAKTSTAASIAVPASQTTTLALAEPATSTALPLQTRPPALALDAIIIDLSLFDPTKRFPGWNGNQPSQASTGRYPANRDLLIRGHNEKLWTGGGILRGGRNVHWLGGAYMKGPFLRNYTGDACFEGILTRSPYTASGNETYTDTLGIAPDSSTMGTSRFYGLNCRSENVDGFSDGTHGDVFQLPAQYDAPSGYCSTPSEVVLERVTGTTAYQGLFLASQHFDAGGGYDYTCRKFTAIDVNLRKTRAAVMSKAGVAGGPPILIYMIDTWAVSRGDKPYPKIFRNLFVEPYADEGLDGCIYPSSTCMSKVPYVNMPLPAIISGDGLSATYPPEMLLDGKIEMGPPPGGDFAKAAGADHIGGLDIPGIGYQSPGYL